MANFAGHLTASVGCGIIGAIGLHEFGHQPSELETLAVLAAGIAGGLSPDIDLGGWKYASIPNKMAKVLSGIVTMWIVSTHYRDPVYMLYGAIGWLAAWIAIDAAMKHRGHTHSWLGAACFAVFFGWVAGLIAGGQVPIYAMAAAGCSYWLHLLLDDLFSGFRAARKLTRMKPAVVSMRPFFTGGNFPELVIVLAIGAIGLHGLKSMTTFSRLITVNSP